MQRSQPLKVTPAVGRVVLASLLGIFVGGSAWPLAAQTADSELTVFLDCERCDDDYLRTEIEFVEYVRDRQSADVHVLVTTQPTGGGGTEYALQFLGQGEFAGVEETLRFASGINDSEDQRRSGMAKVLQGGLIRYASRTPLIQSLELELDAEGGGREEAPARDPWNAWVFEIEFGGDVERESSLEEMQINAGFAAERTTASWKTELEARTRYSQDDRLVRDQWIRNLQRDHGFETLTVRSLSDHWSVGGTSEITHSTFSNRDLAFRLAPAVEFNFFPYAESTSRSLTLQYSVGGNQIRYLEETLYGHTDESLVNHEMQLSLEMRRPWGSLDAEVEGSQFLHDVGKYSVEADGGLEVNLFRGLAIELRGSAERIHDQLHLPGGDRTPEEILLEQRELATAFRYGASLGLSYSFGSIFNSVVNPRMSDEGGRDF